MAITQAICQSWRLELLDGIHDMNTDTIKLALYTSAATLGVTTTAYTTSNEVVGTGYTAGGVTLTGATIALSGSTAYVDFDNVVIPSATITARGALIYNSSKANRAIAVVDFGSDRTSTASDFTITFPAPGVGAVITLG